MCGVPVICSDIPVLREQLERLGGQVLWFDPHNPHGLAAALRELEDHYDHYRYQANRQKDMVRSRSWRDVARDYWTVFRRAATC